MKNLSLGFPLPLKSAAEEYDIPALINRIQQYAFQRRLRVKDAFRDFDQLRCGRCTRQQFIRGVNTTVSFLRKDELEAIADYYTEEGVHVQRPAVVAYKRFVAAVEEVFTVARLEMEPTRPVPRAGSSLQHKFRPNSVGVVREDERVSDILQKIALLCKTRGVVFLSCFQDCDRSDSVSLVTPRYCGKASPAQFRQHFPLVADFNDNDLRFLIKRYKTPSGDINYQALDRDIKDAERLVPPPTGEHAPSKRVPQSPASAAADKKTSADRCRREALLQETRLSVDIMEKLKAIVAERRLRLADCFVDFDKLRKGVCTMTQLRTVFTILGVELHCSDYNGLLELYGNEEGHFRYREFCASVCELQGLNNIQSWDMELPLAPYTAREERPGSRIRYKAPLDIIQQDRVLELEEYIRNRAEVRSLDLKRCFQDFDRVCTGHVTRTQFARIMNMLQCELSYADTQLLCQSYCDTDSGQEFNYIDLCRGMKLGAPMEDGVGVRQASSRPKYFDRSGESVSPFIGLKDLNDMPFLDPVVSKVGGAMWSRAYSR